MFLAAFIIFAVALFTAGYLVWTVPQQRSQQVLASRLRQLRVRTATRTRSPDLVREEKRGSFAFLGDFFAWVGLLRRLQEYIDQANLKYRSTDVAALCLILLVGTYLLLGLFGMSLLLLRIMLSLLVGFVPLFLVLRARARRLRKFEETFPDAIDLFNRAMKAGHNIHSGLETVAQETFDPVRMEFKKVIEELALGSPLEDALHNLGKRVPVIDLKFFITGIILQRQTGANMVEVLENLSLLVRERLNLAAKLKAATAQQRLSAGLLCAMPVVVGIGFWFVKPEYVLMLFTDRVGSMFLTYAVVSEIIGILVVRKIASMKY